MDSAVEARSTLIDYREIAQLAEQGVYFAQARVGTTRSNLTDWPNLATTNKVTLQDWIKSEYGGSLVVVAKCQHNFTIDVDDPAECERRGFKREWLEGYYAVDTPSGGEHHHGLHDASTERFGSASVLNVYRIKDDKNSGKVLEVKLDRQSVAAPTAWRDAVYSGDGALKKCAGTYKPRILGAKLKRGIHPDLLAWLTQWGEIPNPRTRSKVTGSIVFHPEFDMDDFLDLNQCSEHDSGVMDGTFVVVPEECPVCGGRAGDSTLPAAKCKFFFGGQSYSFVCHRCEIQTRDEYEERMAEVYEDWEPWAEFIYETDDLDLLFEQWGVEDANEVEAQWETEEVQDLVEPMERKIGSQTEDFTYEAQDTGNGERLVKKFGHLIRWISETNEWMVWGANGWRKDTSGTLMRMTKTVLKDLINDAYSGDKPDMNEVKHAFTSGRVERRKAMMTSAGFEQAVFTNIIDWDANGWIFNCANGVIELQSQSFRERTKADLCMRQSPIVYDPDAIAPLWVSALNKYFCGDQELIDFFQAALGMTLTSDTSQQALFFNQGGGENGKDTVFTVINYIMGNYWQNVSFDTFVTANHTEHRNDLAVLSGAVRMVTAAESTDGHSLDEAVIKQVTGCSPVTCRHILGKPFTYVPQYKLWFMSNYEPVIKGQDWGIWRRVKRIPWDYTIKSEEKDESFSAKLKAEAPGILNWMLAGLKRYIELGHRLPPCKAVDAATTKYREDMDVIGRFEKERLTFSAGAIALGPSLYHAYSRWCKRNSFYPMNSRKFYADFRKRHPELTEAHQNTGAEFHGVGLLFDGSYLSADLAE
jgi:putative DNA primase/helicase